MNIVVASNGSDLLEGVTAIQNTLQLEKPFILKTSGTTGVPKEILVDLKAALGKKKAGDSNERWLLCYSPARWAGVSVVLHAIKSDCTLCVPESNSFPHLLNAICELNPTHASWTPSLFRNLVRTDESGILQKAKLRQITFGGEAATQSVLDLASSIWPSARITHVYASTELGDICSVSDRHAGVPREKFARFSFSEEGELLVNGSGTGDFWELIADRYYFRGRKEEIINVGGNKVSPLEIEEFAMRNGALAARAFGVANALMGSLVGLEYSGGPHPSELSLKFRSAFPKYACPASMKQVDEIPISEAGKTKRIQQK